MRYDEYKNRVLKVARVFAWIKKHIVIISVIAGVLVTLTAATLAMTGTVLESHYPTELIYGESPAPNAKAFLSKVTFEYREASGKWSQTPPILPGKYQIRSVGKAVGGNPRYGDVAQFVIKPKRLEVRVSDTHVVYGEMPAVSADTVYGDSVICDVVNLKDSAAAVTTAEPQMSAISVLDVNGQDVTGAYDIVTVTTSITVVPRDITVTVDDASKTYDGKVLRYDVFALTEGTLANGDVLQAQFHNFITDAGSIPNQPILTVLNKDAKDVTHLYNINQVVGSLTVQPRPITVTSNDLSTVYSGEGITNEAWFVTGNTSLISGHSLRVEAATVFTDAGTYENCAVIRVVDKNGRDKTDNYAITVSPGAIEILKRPVEVITPTQSWVYDGETHTTPEISVSGLVTGHQFYIAECEGIQNAGTVQNTVEIKILNGETDVTANYDIEYQYGSLTVSRRRISIYPASVSEIYDGTEKGGGEILCNTDSPYYPLADGDLLACTVTGAITDVGTSRIEISEVKITRGENDVTANYDITTSKGSITVTPRPITVALTYAEKVYDGTPLTSAEYSVWADEPLTFALVEGHSIVNLTANGSQTDAGSSENLLTGLSITDAEGNDKTQNYDVTRENGTLTVTKRPITITVLDAEKIYDGTPLTSSEYEVSAQPPLEEALVNGHRLKNLKFSGSQTEVGTSENCLVDFDIVDSRNRKKTDNYNVTVVNGELHVYLREIVLGSGSAEKPYDGKPLTCHDAIRLVEGSLCNGHRLNMRATGEQTEVGSSANTIEGDVIDRYGNSVTDNYRITYSYGILRVLGNSLDEDHDDESEYVAFKVYSERNGWVYFRDKSYGDYTGSSWYDAPSYPHLLDGKYSYHYLSGFALENKGYAAAEMRIKSYVSAYHLPYYLAKGDFNYKIQTDDTKNSGPYENEYSFEYYYYSGTGSDLVGKLGDYSDEELGYRRFVYENYLAVDARTAAYLNEIIESKGWDSTDPDIVNKVAAYVKNAATYNTARADALDNESYVVIAFLDEYKEGVCRHYAASATLIYRLLGIPARYTVGFAGETVAGEWTDIKAPGHAWTEIYIDGVGWIPIEVTPSSGGNGPSGSGDEEDKSFTVRPKYQYKVYDGTALRAEDLITGDEIFLALLQAGYTYEVDVTGSRTKVGKSTSTISSFTLYDPNRNDVTDEYDIAYEPGVIEIFSSGTRIVRLYLHQLRKYYDGNELTFTSDDYHVTGLEEGDSLRLTLNISMTDAGILTLEDIRDNQSSYISYKLYSGNKNITSKCKIILEAPENASECYIPICIDPRPIELTANSISKMDDNTELRPGGVTVTKGDLVAGHILRLPLINGVQIGIGSSECFIDDTSIIIVDANGNNVTNNYFIDLMPGTLEIYDPYSQ